MAASCEEEYKIRVKCSIGLVLASFPSQYQDSQIRWPSSQSLLLPLPVNKRPTCCLLLPHLVIAALCNLAEQTLPHSENEQPCLTDSGVNLAPRRTSTLLSSKTVTCILSQTAYLQLAGLVSPLHERSQEAPCLSVLQHKREATHLEMLPLHILPRPMQRRWSSRQ